MGRRGTLPMGPWQADGQPTHRTSDRENPLHIGGVIAKREAATWQHCDQAVERKLVEQGWGGWLVRAITAAYIRICPRSSADSRDAAVADWPRLPLVLPLPMLSKAATHGRLLSLHKLVTSASSAR